MEQLRPYMLKIKLENESAKLLIFKFKSLIDQNQPFAVFAFEAENRGQLCHQIENIGCEFSIVEGINTWDEVFTGIIVATTSDKALLWRSEIEKLSIYQSEKPYIFVSRTDVEKIWPHETLEDRVTDVCLAALSGYAVPRTAELIEALN